MLYMIFQSDREPVLIQRIFIALEAILENFLEYLITPKLYLKKCVNTFYLRFQTHETSPNIP